MRKLIALLLASGPVFAGTASGTWTAPATYTDGTPITVPLTYKVYGAVQGQTKALLSTVSTTSSTHNNIPGGVTYCFQVSAVASGIEGGKTNDSCVVMPPLVPNPPTGLTVTVVTAYRMRLSVDSYEMVALGTIPLGTACVEGKLVDGLSPVPRSAVVKANQFDTLPPVVFAKCG